MSGGELWDRPGGGRAPDNGPGMRGPLPEPRTEWRDSMVGAGRRSTHPRIPRALECTGAQAVPELQISQRVEQLPPWKVILHNDDVNTFEHVIATIVKLTPLKPEDAVERALEAHETGQSLLLVTHRERAELYCEQFRTFKIEVTCEPEA